MGEALPRKRTATWLAALAVVASLLLLDLAWLGAVARDFYASELGSLERNPVYLPAALLFYAFYASVILLHGVLGASGLASAVRRGAALGLVAYATYDLTNWAVVRGWPATLVPVDILWGVVLTGTAAAAGRWALERAGAAAGSSG